MFQEILSDQDIEKIHRTSMKLLEKVGVDFPCADAVVAFQKHGCKTDGQRIYLSEDQVMKALASAPKQFPIHARNPERNVLIGGGSPVFAPGYGAPFLVDTAPSVDGALSVDGAPSDNDIGSKRVPSLADYDKLVKIAHNLPNQDLSGHLLVEPGDVGIGTAHLWMLYAHMVHSDKPFIGSTAGKRGAQHTVEMARILFGGDLGGKTVCIGLINSLTPLGYSTEMLEALLEYARLRQPLMLAALAMAGSTAPITLAGVLALQNAELLAGIVLTQLISPGTPVIFGSTSTNIDMKSGVLAIGSPELSQLVVAHAQLARHYGLPSRSGGALTDASYPDAQAGFESMISLLTAVSAGADFVLHAGGILSSYLAFSYEKFVLDDEMCGLVRRFRQGLVVDDRTLAYDVIANVGPGGNYLTEAHTVKRCRTEFWQPDLCDRAGLEAWLQGGQQTAVDRARQRWQKLVAEHEDPPLDATTVHQLQAFVQEHLA